MAKLFLKTLIVFSIVMASILFLLGFGYLSFNIYIYITFGYLTLADVQYWLS